MHWWEHCPVPRNHLEFPIKFLRKEKKWNFKKKVATYHKFCFSSCCLVGILFGVCGLSISALCSQFLAQSIKPPGISWVTEMSLLCYQGDLGGTERGRGERAAGQGLVPGHTQKNQPSDLEDWNFQPSFPLTSGEQGWGWVQSHICGFNQSCLTWKWNPQKTGPSSSVESPGWEGDIPKLHQKGAWKLCIWNLPRLCPMSIFYKNL